MQTRPFAFCKIIFYERVIRQTEREREREGERKVSPSIFRDRATPRSRVIVYVTVRARQIRAITSRLGVV